MNKKLSLETIKSVIIGHAVGDALGVPAEFSKREDLKISPITKMEGYGAYAVPKGSWSDDTSMAICALDAFGDDKLNFDKVMNNFAKWYYQGEYTPTGKTFDVGKTCAIAIERYSKTNVPWKECGLNGEFSNGNGSLMRIHPFALYTFALDTTVKTKIRIIELASSLTHAHPRSKIACGIYTLILWQILESADKIGGVEAIKQGLRNAREIYRESKEFEQFYSKLCHQIVDIDNLSLPTLSENEIKSDGYVVHSLEAAIWCLCTTNSYKDCVLKAVNLGSDTDTIAGIAGGLAGAIYGYESIPREWREDLLRREYIEDLCAKGFKKFI